MRTCTDVQAAFCSGTWRHRPGQSERGAYQSCKVCHGSEPASESWRYQQNTHGGVGDDFQQSSYFYPRMSRPQPMAKCRGGGEGVSVKAESPGRARRGPPTSPPALYKRARSSAARQWLLHAHKEGVLAPRETVPLRIATTRAFGSVDYPHCQEFSQNETGSRSATLSRLRDLLRGGCCEGGRSHRVQTKMDELGTEPGQAGREAAGSGRRRAGARTDPGREGSPRLATQRPGGCSQPRQALPPER